jgi:mono/diheme cytochrome c family protein
LAVEKDRNFAADTLAIFSAKCAGCHGPNVSKPKGRFGYVLDLARVRANREIVVPFSPDESELFELVRRGEMPPTDAPNGALTVEQKETIRSWIAAGAPVNSEP